MPAFQRSFQQQLELIIPRLANKWLALKIAEHGYNPEMIRQEAEKFLNLSLRAVYGMVSRGVFSETGELQQDLLEKEALLNYLKGGTELTFAKVQKLADGHNPGIVKIISEKTRITSWMQKMIESRRMSLRLKNVLKINSKRLNYLEDITQEIFLDYRNAGMKTWEEFVKLRGY